MLLLVNKVYFSPLSAQLFGYEEKEKNYSSFEPVFGLSTFYFWPLFLTTIMGCFIFQGFMLF